MVVSVSIASGFQRKIRDKMSGFKGNMVITNYDMNNSDVSIVPISKKQDFYPKFPNIKEVTNVQVYANKAGIIRTDKSFEGVIFKGVDKDYDFKFFKEYLVEGRLPNFNLKRNKEVVISKTIADRLHIKLGDTIQALFSAEHTAMKFKQRKPIVVGIYNTGFAQFDKLMMIGDIREVQYLNKWKPDQVGGFEVLIDDFDKLEKVGEQVQLSIPPTLENRTIVQSYPAIFEWFDLVDNNVLMIISFVLIIALINMTTALLVLILERVQLVGILKSLGATNWSIQKIFLYNATALVVKGMIWGNIVGISLLLIQKYGKILTLNPENYYVSVVPVDINIWSILLLNILTVVLCFLVLIIPSIIITKIQPSKSIKFA